MNVTTAVGARRRQPGKSMRPSGENDAHTRGAFFRQHTQKGNIGPNQCSLFFVESNLLLQTVLFGNRGGTSEVTGLTTVAFCNLLSFRRMPA